MTGRSGALSLESSAIVGAVGLRVDHTSRDRPSLNDASVRSTGGDWKALGSNLLMGRFASAVVWRPVRSPMLEA